MDRTDSAATTSRAGDAAFYGDSTTPGASPVLAMDAALPSGFLRAMAACASQDPTRLNLNAVYFHGIHVIVTDGHTLTRAAVLPVEGREGRDYLIPCEMITRATKIAGARGIVEVWVGKNAKDGRRRGEFRCYARPDKKASRANAIRGAMLGVVEWSALLMGFPPYEQVIPAFDASPALVDHLGKPAASCEPSARIVGHGVNPRYLARMADVIDGIDESSVDTPVVLRSCKGPLDPIAYTAMVRTSEGVDRRMITFVIMPMRVTASDYDATPPTAKPAKGPKVTVNPCLSGKERKAIGL